MRTVVVVLAVAVAIGTSGCAASRTTSLPTLTFATLASATATIVSADRGRNTNSPLTVHLLRSHAELGAEIRVRGMKFDDTSSSGALGLSLVEPPFTTNDLHDGQLRLRLMPGGDGDWTFDLHVAMRFSDGTARNFTWRGLRLDYADPNRVLLLAAART